MAETEKRIWGIHSYNDHLFLKQNRIGIGWNSMGDLSAAELALKYYEGISEKYQRVIPLEKVYIPVPADEQEASWQTR